MAVGSSGLCRGASSRRRDAPCGREMLPGTGSVASFLLPLPPRCPPPSTSLLPFLSPRGAQVSPAPLFSVLLTPRLVRSAGFLQPSLFHDSHAVAFLRNRNWGFFLNSFQGWCLSRSSEARSAWALPAVLLELPEMGGPGCVGVPVSPAGPSSSAPGRLARSGPGTRPCLSSPPPPWPWHLCLHQGLSPSACTPEYG